MKAAIMALALTFALVSCATSQSTCKLRAEVYYPVFDGLLGGAPPVRLLLRFPPAAGPHLVAGQAVRITFPAVSSEMTASSLGLLPLTSPTKVPFISGQVIGRSENVDEILVKIDKRPCDSLKRVGLEYDPTIRKYVWLSVAVTPDGEAIIEGCTLAGTEKNAPLLIK